MDYSLLLTKVERFCMGALTCTRPDAQDLASQAVAIVWEKYGDRPEDEQTKIAFATAKRKKIDGWRRAQLAPTTTHADPWQQDRDTGGFTSDPERILIAKQSMEAAHKFLGPKLWERVVFGIGDNTPMPGHERAYLSRMRRVWKKDGDEGLAGYNAKGLANSAKEASPVAGTFVAAPVT
jgi:hypothetical protein